MMVAEYNCMHEELIQDHSLKINELTSRADYKDKRIDELYTKMEKMEEKLDRMNENINKLILKSNQGDTDLELRLKAIETGRCRINYNNHTN